MFGEKTQGKKPNIASPLLGSYKLDAMVLLKMISASSTYKDRYAGASRYEIFALIHLSHLADSMGAVEHFRATEFMEALGCSRREAFSLMRSLEEKGYIEVSPSGWKHCYDILILNNDFSLVGKKSRYLNTNHELFERGRFSNDELLKLSLTSLRLLLFLLFNYTQKYGYHASYTGIMQALGIRHKSVINRCLDELDPVLSCEVPFYQVREDLKKGLKYGFIDIAPKEPFFRFDEGIERGKVSYFKRHLRLMVEEAGCVLGARFKSIDELLTDTFAVFQSLIDKGKDVKEIYDVLSNILKMDGVYDEYALYHFMRDPAVAQYL